MLQGKIFMANLHQGISLIIALGEKFLDIVAWEQREEEHFKALCMCCQSGTQFSCDLRGHK